MQNNYLKQNITIKKDKKNVKTLLDYFHQWEKKTPEKAFLKQPFGKTWKTYSWKEVGVQARSITQALRSWNLPLHSSIALVSKNCPHWIMADLAIMMSGHISVPLFPTLNAEQLRQILIHSETQVIFIGKLDNWKEMKEGIPSNVKVIVLPHLEGNDEIKGENFLKWEDLLIQYEPYSGNYKANPDNLAIISYTSGTTGTPKGVMTSYYALAKVTELIEKIASFDPKDNRFFSYLPLNHITERVVVEAAALQCGGEIYFTESVDTFVKNLQDACPTHFLAVPRTWSKLQQGILEKIPQKKLDKLLKLPVISGIVKKKIKKALGLDKAKFILTGTAPIPAGLLEWYEKIGLDILEGYGMSENTAACTINSPGQKKIGTVGKAQEGAEIKIDPETREILMRAEWIMQGYFKEAELTAQTIDEEGWLHTGDQGELDEDNFLKITGRIKDFFKTAKGEYISPFVIENHFAHNHLIEQICIMGSGMPQAIALIVLSEIGKNASKEEIKEYFEKEVEEINTKVYAYEGIKKVVIVRDDWTVKNGLLSPTLKMRRSKLENKYQHYLEDWYKQKSFIIWE